MRLRTGWSAMFPSVLRPPRAVLLGALFIFGLLPAACRPVGQQPEADGNPAAAVPDQVFEGFEMALTESGIKKGFLKAERAEKFQEPNQFKVLAPEVVFYDEQGQVTSILISRRGVLHLDSGLMEAFDSVVVVDADSSRTLRTERLLWRRSENLIVSDTTVLITTPQGQVRGTGLTTNVGLEHLEVLNPTGDIHVLGQAR